MIEGKLIATMLEQIGTGTVIEGLDNQVALLVDTRVGSIPLDRELGLAMEFVDKPGPLSKTIFTAEVTAAVSKFLPTVRVKEVEWEQDALDGKFKPKVVITNV